MISIYHCLFESLLQFRTTNYIADFKLFLTLTIIEMSEKKNDLYVGDREDENQVYTQRELVRF